MCIWWRPKPRRRQSSRPDWRLCSVTANLLRAASPTLVSTYAFVNPVVAVSLGALVRDEALTPRLALGAALIVPAVVLIVLAARRKP